MANETLNPLKYIALLTAAQWKLAPIGPLVAVDFETFYSTDYSVATLGSWAYANDPRFSCYMVSVSDGTHTFVGPPLEFPWPTIAGKEWVSHNREFDFRVWERLVKDGAAPAIGPSQWYCSASAAAFMQVGRSLADAALGVLRILLDKAPRTAAKGKRNPDTPQMRQYAARDAIVCLQLWLRLRDHWPQCERNLFELTSAMGNHGLCIDWQELDNARAILQTEIARAEAGLPWRPSMSLKKFGEAVASRGTIVPPSTATSSPAFRSWRESSPDQECVNWVDGMQEQRSANRTLKVLDSMAARRMPNGRMAYELKYFGASTGRWAGGGGLNLQNFNRNSVGEVDLRRLIIAPPHHVLGIIDYSQIEARVLLYLAGDQPALARLRERPQEDMYEAHARMTMGYTDPRSLKDYCTATGSPMRQLAKARVLGLGFQCGASRFVYAAQILAGITLTESQAKEAVDAFRESNRPITRYWYDLHDRAREHAGKHFALQLPAFRHNPGTCRRLIYRALEYNGRDPRDLMATISGKRQKIYGGKLAENITQATARDVLAGAWQACANAGYRPVLTVHDELVFELPEATAIKDLKVIQGIMGTSPPWAPDLPLLTEGTLQKDYSN